MVDIIYYCSLFFGLFKDQDKTGNIIGLIVGIYLLLYCQGLINFQFAWKLVVPVIFVLIGLKMIFKDTFNKKETSSKYL